MEDSGNVRVRKEYNPPPSNNAPLHPPNPFVSVHSKCIKSNKDINHNIFGCSFPMWKLARMKNEYTIGGVISAMTVITRRLKKWDEHLVGLIHAEYLRIDMSCCISSHNKQSSTMTKRVWSIHKIRTILHHRVTTNQDLCRKNKEEKGFVVTKWPTRMHELSLNSQVSLPCNQLTTY